MATTSAAWCWYLGVANSILIASYYVPVAAALAAMRLAAPAQNVARRDKDKDKAKPEPEETAPDPFAPFRTAAMILAPALIGVVGELLQFTG